MNPVDLDIIPKVEEHLTWLEIDREALLRNLEKIRAFMLPTAEILAVVKANAYGHGLLEISEILSKKVAYLGVASIEEARKLRHAGIETPILLFGIQFEPQIKTALDLNITLSLSSFEQAEMVNRISEELAKPARVHIKVDTGMGRLGIPLGVAKKTITKIVTLPNLKLEGIYTHFPSAEKLDEPFTAKQIKDFNDLIQSLSDKGISFAYRHSANSAGIFHHKSSHLNMVRPGLALYGIYPHPEIRKKIELEPVLTWRSRVILVKNLKAGESAGYGRTYIAKQPTKIALLPVGYSHGYPVALSGKSQVLIHGKRYQVAGRISMDYIAIEIGQDMIQVGDQVTLLGSHGLETISAEELAELAGTIPYEIVTGINPQIARFFK